MNNYGGTDFWSQMMAGPEGQGQGQPSWLPAAQPAPMGPGAAPPMAQGAPAPGATAGGAPAQGAPNPQDRAMMDLYTRISGLQPQQQEIARKKAMIGQLRQGAAMPGMRQAGRVQQAANPLEFLSSLGHAGAAAYQDQQTKGLEDQYSKARGDQFGQFRKTMGFDPTGQ